MDAVFFTVFADYRGFCARRGLPLLASVRRKAFAAVARLASSGSFFFGAHTVSMTLRLLALVDAAAFRRVDSCSGRRCGSGATCFLGILRCAQNDSAVGLR